MKSFLFFLCRAATLFIVNTVSGVELAITSPGRHAVCFFSLTSLQKIKCELKLPVSAASTTTLHYKLHYKLHTERLFGGREHLLRSSRNGGLGGGGGVITSCESFQPTRTPSGLRRNRGGFKNEATQTLSCNDFTRGKLVVSSLLTELQHTLHACQI